MNNEDLYNLKKSVKKDLVKYIEELIFRREEVDRLNTCIDKLRMENMLLEEKVSLANKSLDIIREINNPTNRDY